MSRKPGGPLRRSASNFLGHADGPTGALGEGERRGDADTSSRRRLVQRREGDDGEQVVEPSSVLLPKLNSQHAATLRKLGSMFRSSVSDPAFTAANWPKSSGSNAGRTARDWVSRLQRSHRRVAIKGISSVAPRSFFAPGLQWADGRNRLLTFRIAITAAVMAFITALTACLILIQIATFHAAAREAAYAAMDAASANTLSRLEAQVSELNSVVRVLSSNPALADSDDRSEVDGAIVVFKTALHELRQTDSLYVGYDNGCWLQVRRLDVLDPTERQKLGAPAGAVYNINLVRPTPGGALPMRRIFEDGQGNKIGQPDLPDYGYDARKRVWYLDTMQTDRALVSSPYASFSIGTPYDHPERTSARACARCHRHRPQAR